MSDPNRTQFLNDPNKTQLGAPPVVDPNKTLLGTAPSLNATQTIKPVQCPVCKTFNPAGVMFCVECGLIFDRALEGDAFGAPAVKLPVLIDDNGREYPIRPGENSVGREGAIALPFDRVSRRHAEVTLLNDAVTVEDLGSTNGTTVNDAPLAQGTKAALNPGDTVSFGGVKLKLSLPGATGAATQQFGGNKTAAISAPPRAVEAAAFLVGNGDKFPLKAGINSFGRKSENDITIADSYVSGKHGLIEIGGSENYLTDIGSTNGTMLNDSKLSPNMRTVLRPGDVIRLGSLEFRIEQA